MTGTKMFKLLGLIVGVVAANVVLQSPGFIGIKIGENALQTATGVTFLLASGIALVYGIYVIQFKPAAAIPLKRIRTHEDYVEALNRYKRVKVLESDVELALDQLERLHKKKESLFDVLQERFEPDELSYKKFAAVIQEVEKLVFLNVRSLLNRLSIFDENEYKRVMGHQPAKYSAAVLEEKTILYNEFMTFIRSSLDTNEEILLKLEKLLVEISRLDSLEPGDIENMTGMREIDALIKQTKFYKQ
ncbi:hypothetical protein E5161_00155 [Cohnella pontilimi]|uniref:Uncharacterized protein n=1 Tax=Cohnella pontilimi TaxID=2564100 RepID=A0A4U0FG44_9BACL|nr:hypothetical protein [Cohnella pontilimi]TJY43861.1 hypothetical protein E5161_00155 [Cohnella pontilimi]